MKIIVYLGTGGVGKTSVAAATALALAQKGEKALVLTIDPANRLRTALRLEEQKEAHRVPLGPEVTGELWAELLDVRATLDEAVKTFGPKASVPRVLGHPIYATIADSLIGMQELMAVERIDQLSRRGFTTIVVDTAPSRHALEFLDKPKFFSDLTGSGWVKFMGRSYGLLAFTGMAALGRKTMDLYARFEAVFGASFVRDVLDFYSLFVQIAEGYSARADRTLARLRDRSVSEFRVVTTPAKAKNDARYFLSELRARRFPGGAVFVNRFWPGEPVEPVPDGLGRELADWYCDVRASQVEAIESLRAEWPSGEPRIVVLDEFEGEHEAREILDRLARQLG